MILILGSNGQVGYELKSQLNPAHIGLLTPTRQELNLTDLEAVQRYLAQHLPQVILNAAAYTQVDKAESEPQAADKLNHQLPQLLAKYSRQHNAYLLHYSTDYVYAGQGDKPQSEYAPLAPNSVYAKTKFAGEQAIQANAAHYSILRTSWVYSFRGHNFMNTMLKLAEQKSALSIVDDQVGTPTSAEYLAVLSLQVLQNRLQGIYNVTQQGETSWCGFAQAIFEQAESNQLIKSKPRVMPITTRGYPTPAQRPLNSRLNCTKLMQALGLHGLQTWQTGLQKEISRRRELARNPQTEQRTMQ